MKLPWNTVMVTGVPGIGKTSLCRIVSKDLGYNYINYGDLMLSIAESKGLASTDPQMFSLDLEVQHEIWKDAALKIKDMDRILVDLHGVDQSSIGYIISLPIGIIKPDIIVLIESLKENILIRRKKDFKDRIIDTIKSLKEHMYVLRIAMATYSSIFGCNFIILQNDDFETCLTDMKRVLGNK
ncbi:MAG: AAA family ATPase [Methanobacterium sp.]